MLTNLSLFSGAGGLDLSAKWTGKIKTVAYVECDPYAQGILMSRMRDGSLDDAPIFEDVRTFDVRSLKGSIDIVSGGFPCQPHSQSGKGERERDKRNLWPTFMRIVRECSPSFVLGENVKGIFTNGYALEVMADLEEAGFCCVPCESSSCAFGGPFPRKRVFFIAHSMRLRWAGRKQKSEKVECRKIFRQRAPMASMVHLNIGRFGNFNIPSFSGMEHGVAGWLDGLRCAGNGVDPYAAQPAWQKIIEMSESTKEQV